MLTMTARFPTFATGVLAAFTAVSLGGCAQKADSPKSLAEITGFTTRVPDPKPFVIEARPSDPAYMAVGVTVKREAVKKTTTDFKAIEQSLDAVKGSNESAGTQAKALGATPPPAPPPVPPPL